MEQRFQLLVVVRMVGVELCVALYIHFINAHGKLADAAQFLQLDGLCALWNVDTFLHLCIILQ